MIQKNHIEADADFAKMKDKLTSMSKKVDEKIEDTTEEDAKQAITELKRLETNLQQTKKNVEAHHSKNKKTKKKGAYQRICLFLKSEISLYHLILSKS